MIIGKGKANFGKGFFDELEYTIAKKMFKDINTVSNRILDSSKKAALASLKLNPVYKGIDGRFAGDTNGLDLQAEFGLTDEMASSAIELLQERLLENIYVEVKENTTTRNAGIVINIGLDESYINDFQGEPFSYSVISKNPKEKIRQIFWMEFLLNAANATIGQYISDIGKYGILYDGGGDSRSGRAVMSKVAANSYRFPYFINKDLVSFSGDNFIEESLNNAVFKEKIEDIVKSIIEKIFK